MGVVLSVIVSFSAHSQVLTKAEPYFNSKEMSDMRQWFKAPPKQNSDEFVLDLKHYYQAKQQRLDPERAAIAVRDSYYGLATIMREFQVPFGLEISRKKTPQIFKLLLDALATTDSICKIPKEYYGRKRPFDFLNERTLTPNAEKDLRKNGSFPSGHAILGWSAALLLSEINPEAVDTLLARGRMFGESRAIVGAHWLSDIEAGFHAASAAYMMLHTSERFLKQMSAARKEFKKFKGKFPPLAPEELSNDSTYIKCQKEKANMESIEHRYQCTILRYPCGIDETTGLKMLYIKTTPSTIGNGVDYVVLANEKNEIVWVVKAVMRHDRDITEEQSLYGLYVVGKDTEGEIEISEFDSFHLERLLFQTDKIPEFLNCTNIKFRVAAVPNLIPFVPTSEKHIVQYERFFKY